MFIPLFVLIGLPVVLVACAIAYLVCRERDFAKAASVVNGRGNELKQALIKLTKEVTQLSIRDQWGYTCLLEVARYIERASCARWSWEKEALYRSGFDWIQNGERWCEHYRKVLAAPPAVVNGDRGKVGGGGGNGSREDDTAALRTAGSNAVQAMVVGSIITG